MKRLYLFGIIIACLNAISCDKVSTEDEQMQQWETFISDNPANIELMAQFLENAYVGVIEIKEKISVAPDGTIKHKDYRPQHEVDGSGGDLYSLISEDGTVQAYTKIVIEKSVYNYRWRVSADDMLVLIFTDDKGEELVARLSSYKDGEYIFEGSFPPFSSNWYTYCAIRLTINTEKGYREKVEGWYKDL